MIIDGKAIACQIKEEVKDKVGKMMYAPSLAVIQVGDSPASNTYVKNKEKACKEVGIYSHTYKIDADVDEDFLLKFINELNRNASVHKILVQLPLPDHIDENRIINAIAPEKDVDGFHPVNVGRLSIDGTGVAPCTPAGIIEMLKRSNIEIDGKHCVIIGRSNIVGKPMAQLMLHENATVTIAHSYTKNLKEIAKTADILIAAVGKPKFITEEHVKDGAVVVDVGINRVDGKLCGDVDFENVKYKCSAITPVPGGVGQMTVAMLMKNCTDGIREFSFEEVLR